MDWFQEEEVSKGTSNPCFSLQWTRWTTINSCLDKPRIAPYKNTWIPHQNSVLVQFKARSQERIAILSNTITRNRSPQHTAFDLYWESGMHEDSGGAIPQGTPISKGASNYTEAEFAKWTTRSTWSRSKKIVRPPERIGKMLRWNPQRQRRLVSARHTSFCSPTTGHESQRNGQKVDPAVREPPEPGVFPAGLT